MFLNFSLIWTNSLYRDKNKQSFFIIIIFFFFLIIHTCSKLLEIFANTVFFLYCQTHKLQIFFPNKYSLAPFTHALNFWKFFKFYTCIKLLEIFWKFDVFFPQTSICTKRLLILQNLLTLLIFLCLHMHMLIFFFN